ncbi:MAG: glycoside hydrolase family 16 [Paludibacteraceae bacterium]|nr:glycoside hydrolase family 16 [Paludibacteraceae bacterium]
MKKIHLLTAAVCLFAAVSCNSQDNFIPAATPDYSRYTDPLLGDNIIVFHDTDDMREIARIVNDLESSMRRGQFSDNRYAVYFAPGDYTQAGMLNVGYYTTMAGLGITPYEVKVSNISTPAPLPRKNALCTFWRSLENLSVIATDGKDFHWGVSQAAPIRRVVSQRQVIYDMGGYGSGGFTADCCFKKSAGSKSQQQWYTRNSYIENGSDGINPGGWNFAYQGVEFGPKTNLTKNSDNWADNHNRHGWENVSRVELTPVIREKPFLYLGKDGRYKVFRPLLRRDCKGISYTENDPGEGDSFDLIDNFYIARPGVTAATLNEALRQGKHLFFTPGIYELEAPVIVENSGTIVLGTGMATLVPGDGNTDAALVLDDGVEDVTVASLLFDAYYSSRCLMRVGSPEQAGKLSCPFDPCLLADLFFRVGGVKETPTHADIMLEINGNRVIGDHFWIWRADHGKGVGWDMNTCKNGLVVNGNGVTVYGLLNEHCQEYQTLWNGEFGSCYFYQSESPYDPYDQSLYMSHDGTVRGYASYKVADHVQNHYACMMGMYDVFVHTQGAEIVIENSIEVPETPEVRIHHACNFGLSRPSGGFNYVINGQVPSTFQKKGRSYILDYPKP